jgi:hypothetical protein
MTHPVSFAFVVGLAESPDAPVSGNSSVLVMLVRTGNGSDPVSTGEPITRSLPLAVLTDFDHE